MDLAKVEQIVKDHDFNPGHLIGILQDIQAQYRYLPKHPLEKVAELLKVPLSQVFSVATFFRAFSLSPRGEKEIHICLGTACHVRGAQRILEEFERGFDLKPGETSKDMKVTLESVMCVGACALGPVVVVNDEYHGRMDATKAAKLINTIKGPKK